MGESRASFIAAMALYSTLIIKLGRVGRHLQENGRSHRSLTNNRYALVASRILRSISSRALWPEVTKFVHSNRNVTVSSLKDSLKSQSGCGKLSGRSTSHLGKEILGTEDRG